MTEQPERSNALTFMLAMLLGTVLSAMLMGAGAWIFQHNGGSGGGLQLTQFPGTINVPSPESGNAIVLAVKKVGGAAVAIETRFGRSGGGLLRNWFGGEGGGESNGSGVIIDGKQGYVLTNAHVVKEATAISIKLIDGKRLSGTVIGSDPKTDIAVIKVPGGNLPQATLGTSKNLSIGEWAIAIGNPYGKQHTVTVGVVSAVREGGIEAPNGYRVDHTIQTDASINPGNSGGPLCNIKGEVIGINTAIIQYAQGIGFAIPIDTAMRVARALIKGERVQHAWLGVVMDQAGASEGGGKSVIVASLEKGSPAAAAGLQVGDAIIEIDHKPMNEMKDVVAVVVGHRPGDTITLVVRRGDAVKHLKVKLTDMPSRLREQS